ncbi:ATP-dependent nuclease [Collinsella tanakaei]|uniref:ATP-dependent nuclease n=1 Tax=Collinsella tanakaei TaxID=626935 RepID=UPI001F44936B|nr:TOPRIM nucleotidyl transferase/hydrolase domain-containing protein [Collinsella tanakaei]MCF2622207.1 hypothetical protein [Collinsella tanakaei]
MPGSIEVVIGPNGYGKTTYLEKRRQDLLDAGVDPREILFLPSEIKLLDEVKDSVDSSQTMEYLMSEMLETPAYIEKRDELFDELDSAIAANVGALNAMLDEVLSLNRSVRSGDFISPNPRKRFIKYPVAINQRDVKEKMGSGQRMQLLLKFAENSRKEHIFLDEPEKYSHPSLLNGTARAINGLVSAGKSVCIATHSPKLVSMLEVSFGDIRIINDATHEPKEIDFDGAVAEASKLVPGGSLPADCKRYYGSGASFRECLERRHARPFIESLFSRHVYLCEGANDELFVIEALKQLGGYYDDYSVVKTWGKPNMPVFIALYKGLDVGFSVVFDIDDELKFPHDKVNHAIRQLAAGHTVVEFAPNLEAELGYQATGSKKGDSLALLDYLESTGIDPKFDPREI